MLFSMLWAPPLVLLHELGHALAAMALTDGEVEIHLRGAGLAGGTAQYDPARLRHSRDEAWIAAAGPAVSLVAGALLALVWLQGGADSLLLGAGAFTATVHFGTTALPLRYGAGLGGPADSDGRVIWRVLTGAPPGGVERELRRMGEPERSARPAFVAVLVVVGALTLAVDVTLALVLVGLFGGAAIMQSKLD